MCLLVVLQWNVGMVKMVELQTHEQEIKWF